MSERPTPETDALDHELHNPCVLQDRYSEMMEHAQKLERERDEAREKYDTLATEHMLEVNKLCNELDEAREAFIEARKHREQLNSLLQSYEACWDEIKTTLGEPEEGDQTCDLDRVLKAIRERNEAREKWKEQNEALRTLAEHGGNEIQKLIKECDEARNKMADALQEVDLRTLDFERMKQERDEAREEVASLRLEAKYHDEADALRKLRERERNEAREALMKIEEIFIDGGDTYLDFVRVGNIATDYLEGL